MLNSPLNFWYSRLFKHQYGFIEFLISFLEFLDELFEKCSGFDSLLLKVDWGVGLLAFGTDEGFGLGLYFGDWLVMQGAE